MHPYLFAISALAVWRITHLLQAEDGPWDLIYRLRRLAGAGFWGGLMDCFYCLSLWMALPFALLAPIARLEKVLWWPALSGAAILLERLTNREQPAPALYYEDNPQTANQEQENPNVMLQQDESAVPANCCGESDEYVWRARIGQ
jgi:hypothetical protein